VRVILIDNSRNPNPYSNAQLPASDQVLRTPRLGRIRRKTHPSHMGHPSGSDGFQFLVRRNGRSALQQVRKNALARAGQAENPPKPRMGIRLAASMLLIAVPVWQAPLRSTRIKLDSIPWAYDMCRRKYLTLVKLTENVPARALPGGKERPSHVGTFGWLRLCSRNVPGLGGPGGKPTQALWGHSVGLVHALLCGELSLVVRERPGLGWARRKTHPSRTGHSSIQVKVFYRLAALSVKPSAAASFFSLVCLDVASSFSTRRLVVMRPALMP
jgi:hypothetical protein